jgi:HEAT repeat protein
MKTSRDKARAAAIDKAHRKLKDLVLRDDVTREQFQKYVALAGPLLADLAAAGYPVETLYELRHQGKQWKTAVPILLRWLSLVQNPGLKEDIVRCLSVPWAGKESVEVLIHEFKKYAPILRSPSNVWSGNTFRGLREDEQKLAPYFNLAWAIGNALSIVDLNGFEKQVIALCKNSKYGAARQMLVQGLGRFNDRDAEDAAVELLNDDQVRLHAIDALARMKSKRALFELEKLLGDKNAVVRKEARKAITKIMR